MSLLRLTSSSRSYEDSTQISSDILITNIKILVLVRLCLGGGCHKFLAPFTDIITSIFLSEVCLVDVLGGKMVCNVPQSIMFQFVMHIWITFSF